MIESFDGHLTTALGSQDPKKLETYVQPLTYAYNAQVHKSTNTHSISLVLS